MEFVLPCLFAGCAARGGAGFYGCHGTNHFLLREMVIGHITGFSDFVLDGTNKISLYFRKFRTYLDTRSNGGKAWSVWY